MKKIKIGLIGLGTVGTGVVRMLEKNGPLINKRTQTWIEVGKILVNDINKKRYGLPPSAEKLLTDDPREILEDSGTDIVVEVMGGTGKALEYVTEALKAGKHVVTANKDMMAEHGGALFEQAEKSGVALLFEASVCAAIPAVEVLKQSLAGNNIARITGILNGTTNYILTKMHETGCGYEEALEEAGRLGYAEADPANDVMGFDSARKIAILASIAFNMRIRGDDVYVQGITGISKSDIAYAEELGYKIKLAAEARITDEGAGVRVNPMFIPLSNPLAEVDDVYNAVYIEGDMSGKIMLYGRGAGSGPTASAVVGDIISIARSVGCVSPAPGCTCFNESNIMPPENARGRFYIRMNVRDNPGVLAQIAGVLGDNGVSIYSVVQKKNEGSFAEIVIITHEVVCRNLENAIEMIRTLDVTDKVNNPIMVEDE